MPTTAVYYLNHRSMNPDVIEFLYAPSSSVLRQTRLDLIIPDSKQPVECKMKNEIFSQTLYTENR